MGRRLHGETSCKLFGALREAVCQAKWKAAGCRSTCLVKISVYFGLLTHHACFTELPLKPLRERKGTSLYLCMLSRSLRIPAEVLWHSDRPIFTSWGDIVTRCFRDFLLLKNMLCFPTLHLTPPVLPQLCSAVQTFTFLSCLNEYISNQ